MKEIELELGGNRNIILWGAEEGGVNCGGWFLCISMAGMYRPSQFFQFFLFIQCKEKSLLPLSKVPKELLELII